MTLLIIFPVLFTYMRMIVSYTVRLILHVTIENLNRLTYWSDIWQIEFNIKKCAIMKFSNSLNQKRFDYKMNGAILETVPYLNAELSDNFKYNIHIISIISLAKVHRHLDTSFAAYNYAQLQLKIKHVKPLCGRNQSIPYKFATLSSKP